MAYFVREERGPKDHALVLTPEAVAQNREELRKLVTGAEEEAELLEAIEGSGGVDPELEDRVFNHLLSFFGRYYRNGDFGYNDRSLATYKVDYPPAEADYDGSDVLLHWKHKDSYYIKTANGFPTVRFEIDGKTHRVQAGDGRRGRREGEDAQQQQGRRPQALRPRPRRGLWLDEDGLLASRLPAGGALDSEGGGVRDHHG